MMRAAVVILALVVATVMASEDVKITETLKSSLIAQMNAGAPPSNACGAGSIDLAGLTKTGTNADYKGTDQNYDYFMNVCAPSTTGGASCNGAGLGICQYITGGSVFVASLGTWPNAVWATAPNAVTATLKDGTKCYISAQEVVRTAIVTFTCGSTTASTFSVTEDDQCNFNLGLVANCGGGSPDGGNGGGLSGGTILLILVVVLVPVYIVIGCIYKAKTKGTTGVESCPNVEFWRDLPGLVKDGFRFTFSKCRGGGGTYNQV